jgi:hypothetical protein
MGAILILDEIGPEDRRSLGYDQTVLTYSLRNPSALPALAGFVLGEELHDFNEKRLERLYDRMASNQSAIALFTDVCAILKRSHLGHRGG